MQQYAIIALLDEPPLSRYSMQNLPLHVTLIGLFHSAHSATHLSEILADAAADTPVFTVQTMDRAMFEGSVSLNHTRHEKPAWVERLEQEEKLENALVPEAGAWKRALFLLFGYCAVATGIFLLIGGLVNSPYITW